jgi:hypothetical protein
MTESEGLHLFIEECHRHPICLWYLPLSWQSARKH